MNAKKAVKRLNRAEVLVSRVLEQFGKRHSQAQELLKTAKESLNRAKAAIGVQVQNVIAKRVPSKAERNQSPRQPERSKKPVTAKSLSSEDKARPSKNAARRKSTVHKTGTRNLERHGARVQPAAKKRVAARKSTPAISKRAVQTLKFITTSATTRNVPTGVQAKSPSPTQTGQFTHAPESAPRVSDGPVD